MRLRVFLLTTGIAALTAAAPARAAVYTVTGTADPGSCDGFSCTGLQAALNAARNDKVADEIDLQKANYAASKGITMSDSAGVTVVGKSAQATTISGRSNVRAIANNGKATLQHLKITGGAISDSDGGGVLNSGTLALDHVEVSGNTADNGAGIASTGSLTVAYSLIAGNTAAGDGGGLFISSAAGAAGATLAMQDSTVAFNTAQIRSGGAGIDIRGNPANSGTLQRVTVADNTGGNPDLGTGGVLVAGDGGVLSVRATIVSGNKNVTGAASNCLGAPRDDGFNLESGSDCGFKSGKQNANPGFPTGLVDGGGETDVLPIPSTSPAVDLEPACTGVTDQRDVPRPQGKGCDAGAYEFDPPPDTTITSGPSGLVNSTTATFRFTSTDPGSTFQCTLDNGAATACSSPQSYNGLAQSAHTLSVQAVDPEGNPDPTPATSSWTIDSVTPDTTLTPIASPTKDDTPSFSFTSSESGSAFECRIDAGSFASCTSPATTVALPDGSHTFSVRATDAAGNTDGTPASQTFTVDTIAPDTTLTPITSPTKDSTPTFSFSSDAGATFECRIDSGSYAACTSPVTTAALSDGSHTFSVRATDAAGNTDATPASQTLVIDTAPPNTTLTAIASPTNDNTPSFSFSSSESGSTFECRVDSGSFTACSSPVTTPALSDGSHAFSVRATDAAGNADGTPDSQTFVVDTAAPNTTLTAIASPTNDNTPSFSFASSKSGSTFECRVDSGSFAPCTSPLTSAALADGSHTFTVRASDAAGNVDATPASQTFVVDTAAPDTTITDGPPPLQSGRNVSFTFGATETGSAFQCKLDGPGPATSGLQSCSSPKAYTGLADGSYTFSVVATDAAGNADQSPAQQAFAIDGTAPAAPAITMPAGDVLQPSATVQLVGTAEANATVRVFDGNDTTPVDATTASGTGAWSLTLGDVADGAHPYTAKAIDAAGNVSPASAQRTVTVDTTPPAKPAITAPADNAWFKTSSPTLSGSAEPAATVTLLEGTTVRATISSDGNGAWSTQLSGVADGTHTYTATATDTAGNVSAASDPKPVRIDTIAPVTGFQTMPPAVTNGAIAFALTSSEAGVTFTCQLVGPSSTGPGTCTSTPSYSGLAQGGYRFLASSTDPAGNQSATVEWDFTIDKTPPAAPTIASPPDNAAVDTSNPTLSGATEAGATVTVLEGTTVRGSTTATGGSWSLQLPTTPDGPHSYTAVATDPAGNASPASPSRTIIVDTVAPATPAITSPADGFRQNTQTVILSGTSEPNAAITVREGATARATAAAGADGAWTVTINGVAEGSYTYKATATDAAGNASPESAARSIVIDLTPPPAPVIATPGDDAWINTPSVTLSGTAEAGATVEVLEGATVAGTAIAAGGNWTVTLSGVSDGTHTYTSKAVDVAGNVGAASPGRTIRVDTAKPAAPAITSPANGSRQKSQTVTLSGTAEANATVTILEDSTPRGSSTAAGGTWSVTLTGVPEGSHAYSATGTDAAGNSSGVSSTRTVIVDLTPPDPPVFTAPGDNSLQNSSTVNLAGTAEPGSTVEVLEGQASLAVVSTGANGVWSASLTEISDGMHVYKAIATDIAGNASAQSSSRTVGVDTGPPDTTVTGTQGATSSRIASFSLTATETATFQCRLDGPGAASGSYAACTSPKSYTQLGDGTYTFRVFATDQAGNADATPAVGTFTVDTHAPDAPAITSPPDGSQQRDTTVTLAGTAEPGSMVEVREAATSRGTTTADGDGHWTRAIAGLAEGAHHYTARATDAAGNTSSDSPEQTIVVDRTAPDPPQFTSPKEAALLDTSQVVLGGTSEAGANVTVFEGTTSQGDATANADGVWTVTVADVPDGAHAYTAKAADPAGNVSDASAARHIAIDTGPPEPPAFDAAPTLQNSSTVTLTGTSEPGATVEVFEGDTSLGTTEAAGGEWAKTLTGVTDGTHTYTARATDVAGNRSELSGPQAVTVDTTAPPTDVTGGPSGVTTDAAPAFSFDSADTTVHYVCRLDGPGGTGAEQACTSPKSFGTLAPGSYTFFVTAIDAAGNRTTSSRSFTVAVVQQVTPTPTPTPSPTPAFHKSVVVQPAAGKVLVRRKGSKTFVALDATQGIPLGSEVDAKHGKVRLSSVPKAGGKPQTALFYGGIFVVTQTRGITQLALSEKLARCASSRAASAAAKKKKPKTRNLWGDGHGSFRTKGRYSAATVRGTRWNVKDSCAGTLTRVKRGVVAVKDFARHRTKVLRAGHRYLAKPKRRR